MFNYSSSGDKVRIAICLGNAPWYNIVTPESVVPKRSWKKEQVMKWLNNHQIELNNQFVKAELLEIAMVNAPSREFLVSTNFREIHCFTSTIRVYTLFPWRTDQIARRYNVEVIRLPCHHCSLNPIELSWHNSKQYIRNNRSHFD